MYTKKDIAAAVEDVTGRATLQEIAIAAIKVRVPFYMVSKVKKALREYLPIPLLAVVCPLSFMEHLFLWRVKWLERAIIKWPQPSRPSGMHMQQVGRAIRPSNNPAKIQTISEWVDETIKSHSNE